MTILIPVISDTQAHLHDQRAIDAVATFLADRDLDSVSVGDVSDSTAIGQWVRGLAGESAGTLDKQRNAAIQILKDLRVKHISRSNHDDRLERYISKHAQGLSSLPELRTEEFLGLNELGIRYHRVPYSVAPGFLLAHGDEGPLSQSPGSTALGLAKRFGRSVICGHTHRMGITHQHSSFNGLVVAPLWGVEVGHMMDMRKAGYLKGGYGNWQTAIGMLVVEDKITIPYTIPIIKGKLYWDGKVYKG